MSEQDDLGQEFSDSKPSEWLEKASFRVLCLVIFVPVGLFFWVVIEVFAARSMSAPLSWPLRLLFELPREITVAVGIFVPLWGLFFGVLQLSVRYTSLSFIGAVGNAFFLLFLIQGQILMLVGAVILLVVGFVVRLTNTTTSSIAGAQETSNVRVHVRLSDQPAEGLGASIAAHFYMRGYRMVDESPEQWVFQRGEKSTFSWKFDIRRHPLRLTVRAATQENGKIQIDCDWDVERWGGISTESDAEILDEEGYELAATLRKYAP